ncbi:MAG TPA: hypothetical protein H9810_09235 [Candidatus Gemmiger excrementavium]|uniref:Uncharacterized protein n=1 Tax=Candidatus Gemmiger excrementavium TaxID=2838608 RepID=A0A9D2JFS0_9FIRM|nr:hypothetical protein [Candidatus Gemmiger excrementavium]
MCWQKYGKGSCKTQTYTREQLTEALRQIDSTLHKLRETVKTLQGKENPARYKSQLTLANRRIEAFSLAGELIRRELAGYDAAQTPSANQ